VTFHDGTPLNAEALKLNIDTYRGVGGAPAITPRLTLFVFQDIASTEVTGPLSVKVTMKRPWVAFPSYWVGRYGIVAPAQLTDRETCATHPIGTGPFEFVEWRPNELLTVQRYDDYWREGLPHLDEITFRPIPEGTTRVNGLTSGQFDLMTTSNSLSILDLQAKAEEGDINVVATDKGAETAYLMLNSGKPPFDEKIARQAVASAGDAREVNEIRNRGLNTIATGPFPPDNDAYLEGIARKPDLKRAKRLNEQYEQEHGAPISFEYLTGPEPDLVAIAQLVKEQQAKAGIEVSIRTIDQAGLINEVLAGNFTGAGFRNHPGGDPDTQYVWWHSGSPVNFGRINDPEIDRLLDEGRSETDPDKRTKIYQDLSRRFADEVYNLWSWYTYWAVGYQKDVKGISGPPLPDGGGKPFALFGGVIPVVGLSKT
jgi:peptide/nickel transport system substrate-binding protein